MAKLILDGKKSEIGPNIDIPTIGKPLSYNGNTLIYDRPLVVTKENLDKYNTF
jgi:simple sugar transport system substrate-binding protein